MAEQISKSESSPALRPAKGAFVEPPQVRRSPSTARAVGSFVPRLTRAAMQKHGFSTATLLTDWPAIVGPELACTTRPLKLKWPRGVESYGETRSEQAGRPGATLHLEVDAARALDVQYKARQVVDRINAYFGYRAVADLRLTQAPMAPQSAPVPRAGVATRPRESRPVHDLGHVTDERLRSALDRLQKGMARR